MTHRGGSGRESLVIQQGKNSLLTQQDFQNFLLLSLREVSVIELHALLLNAEPLAGFLIILNFALSPLFLDLVFNIIDALPQDLLQEILLLNFLACQGFYLSQLLFLGLENLFQLVD